LLATVARSIFGAANGSPGLGRTTSRSDSKVSRGAVFVTAEEINWQNAYDFIEDQRTTFKAKRSKGHRAKKGEKQ
jgi:hypothetical protein